MSATPIPLFFVLLPGSLILDWAGPAEAFRIANQLLAAGGHPPRFELRFAGPRPAPPTSVGVQLAGVEPLPARLPSPSWVLLVGTPGSRFDPAMPGAPETIAWLRGLAPGQGGLRRGPQDPQLSPFLAYRDHMHPALHRVQDAVSAEPQRPWTVPAMADAGHTSPRHLTRLFLEHGGVAPLQYLRRIRLAVAQAALESGRNVTQAAELAGFSSDTQLRRAWRQFGQRGRPSDAGLSR